MRNLRFRRAARTSVLGTAALLAALSLTACQEDGSSSAVDTPSSPTAGTSSAQPENGAEAPAEKGEDTSGTDSASSASGGSGSDSGSGSGSGSSGSGDTQPAAKKPQGGGDAEDDGPVTLACDAKNTKVTITPVSRPLNHMLLSITNTGSGICNAYGYPSLRFGEAQSVPPVFEDSKPQAVASIAPGETAYAGVRTSSADGSGEGGYSTKDLVVGFQGRSGGFSGASANVTLGKDAYVDSSLSVTYWQTDMENALMW
ncbi:DUF4232 domain-containing protein [Streptomyces nitrosporeus]|uniref:DUF4232 domain-containing protein n=1 Tax=Streptomyces nitrosporeus TaxID=28894 RepID=A0A5J6FBL6_9ACTN|nr:DUF4232 domain-containing protein [Streptomyces nitrosporeus]QEU73879.1 DUF4232 domain-containing protein [Streptomyces nitrosporeus]GGZ25888.1 hypothetical protein GCM10010327_65670 [Streptomyces nitrosporeus]